MISSKTRYGLKAVVCLAKNYQQRPVLIADLAKKEKIPQKFLESILLELRKNGILSSKKGKGGGYGLARPPDEIYIGEVIRVLEGAIISASSENQSEIDAIIKEVQDAMSNILDKTSLTDLIEKVKKGEEILNFVI